MSRLFGCSSTAWSFRSRLRLCLTAASCCFCSAWINSSKDWETLAYTSLVPAGPYSAYIVYQKYSTPKWGSTSASYMMQVSLAQQAPRPKYQAGGL